MHSYRFLSRCAVIPQFDNGLSGSVGTEQEMTKLDLEGLILVFPTSKHEEVEKHLKNLIVCLLNADFCVASLKPCCVLHIYMCIQITCSKCHEPLKVTRGAVPRETYSYITCDR